MVQLVKSGSVIVLLILIITPANTQSLFESSQSGTQETLVSSDLSLGGFIRSVTYFSKDPENNNGTLQSAYGQVGLLLNASAGEWATANADIRFRYGTEYGNGISEMDIREAYIDLWAGPARISFGKLIAPWGKGTIFNPTDKITPLNPTVRSPEEDDMLLGFWGAQGQISLGTSMKLAAIWKPLFEPSVLLIEPVPMPEYVIFTNPDFPTSDLNQGSFGLKYDLFTSALDLSLYWFEGYHHMPGIAYDSFVMDTLTMEPVALNLNEKAYRIRMAGMDFSLPLGGWILRAEGAWQQTMESHESAEYLPLPELSYTAEIERAGSYVSFIAGYYGKYIMDYTPPAAEPSLSAQQDQFYLLIQKGLPVTQGAIDGVIKKRIGSFNRLYNYQMEEFYHTIFVVGKAFILHDKIELSIPLIHHITTNEWIVQPALSYKPTDGFKISAGYSGLYGPENSLYDMVGPVLSAGYLSFKLSF